MTEKTIREKAIEAGRKKWLDVLFPNSAYEKEAMQAISAAVDKVFERLEYYVGITKGLESDDCVMTVQMWKIIKKELGKG